MLSVDEISFKPIGNSCYAVSRKRSATGHPYYCHLFGVSVRTWTASRDFGSLPVLQM